MQSILNERQLEVMDLVNVQRLLDVGSGLGQLSRAMARSLQPGSVVVGIERDERQLQEAKRQAQLANESALVEFRLGDAANPLPPS